MAINQNEARVGPNSKRSFESLNVIGLNLYMRISVKKPIMLVYVWFNSLCKKYLMCPEIL